MNFLKYIILLTYPIFSESSSECDQCINSIKLGENVDCKNICYHQETHLTDCVDYTRCLYDYNLHKINNLCVCQKTNCIYDYVCPNVNIIDDTNFEDYTIFEVSLEIINPSYNIYAIYGEPDNPMIIPKAYQTRNHLGVNIGGINPLLINYYPNAQYDSWLTIAITDGNTLEQVDSIGIDYSLWNNTQQLIITDGAIFLDNPLEQLSSKKYIIAHLTLHNNEVHNMIINVNGRMNYHDINSPSFSEKNINIQFPLIYDTEHSYQSTGSK